MNEVSTATAASGIKLRRVEDWKGIRVLTWDGDFLYACRGYTIIRRNAGLIGNSSVGWDVVAGFRPGWWRNLTSRMPMTARLVRDGFHALTILGGSADETMIGVVPGALIKRDRGSPEFQVTHKVQRGTRPLHVTAVPSGQVYWGEYFDNRERMEVHIYASIDRGSTWHIAHTFPARSVRHIHNIVYDRFRDCLWILTGDEGAECQIIRASSDLSSMEVVLSGNQQARAVAGIPTKGGLYFSTDTPSDHNHVYLLDDAGKLKQVGDLSSSSIQGCRVGEVMVFSTMVEPSDLHENREVHVVGSADGANWQVLARWKKDSLPMRYFQYGNAFLPEGENRSPYLAATTIAVKESDFSTTIWEVEQA